jgi:predicted dehydrogenase
MTELSIGVVGLGYWGPNVLRNFYACPGATVRYACDLAESNLARVRSQYPSVETTSDFDQLLNDDGLQAVAIATPVSTHFDLARRALEAGKHVLVEKPITATAAEAEALIEIASQKQLVLMVDHTFVYTGAVRKMKEIVSSGELGDLFYLDSQRMNLGLIQADIDVIWDLAPHDLSILSFLVDKDPVSVYASGSSYVGNPDLCEVAYLTIRYEGNFQAHVASSWLSPVKMRQMVVCGSRKMILYDDIEPTEKIRVYDKGVDLEWDEITPFNPAYRSGDVVIPQLDQTEALQREAAHFVECVSTGSEPLTSARSGLRVVRILEAATESLRSGSPVAPA